MQWEWHCYVQVLGFSYYTEQFPALAEDFLQNGLLDDGVWEKRLCSEKHLQGKGPPENRNSGSGWGASSKKQDISPMRSKKLKGLTQGLESKACQVITREGLWSSRISRFL